MEAISARLKTRASGRLAGFWLVGLYVTLLLFMQLIYPLLVVLAIVAGGLLFVAVGVYCGRRLCGSKKNAAPAAAKDDLDDDDEEATRASDDDVHSDTTEE